MYVASTRHFPSLQLALIFQVPVRQTRQSMPGLRPARAARHDTELPGLPAEGANGEVHAGPGNI